MELMSSLLLCALLANTPRALGMEYSFYGLHQKPQRSKILLNLNGPPLVNMITELQYVFTDKKCEKCIDCMERAIKAYKEQTEISKLAPSSHELHEEILDRSHSEYRFKRDISTTTVPTVLNKTKPFKKRNKSVTVTKYNVGGEVYGLRVKEHSAQDREQNETDTSVCRIYNVKKSYECDTPESDTFLAAAKKKKVNKKNRREKERSTMNSRPTEKMNIAAPAFRKRHIDHVDQGDTPDNFELSIEGMY